MPRRQRAKFAMGFSSTKQMSEGKPRQAFLGPNRPPARQGRYPIDVLACSVNTMSDTVAPFQREANNVVAGFEPSGFRTLLRRLDNNSIGSLSQLRETLRECPIGPSSGERRRCRFLWGILGNHCPLMGACFGERRTKYVRDKMLARVAWTRELERVALLMAFFGVS